MNTQRGFSQIVTVIIILILIGTGVYFWINRGGIGGELEMSEAVSGGIQYSEAYDLVKSGKTVKCQTEPAGEAYYSNYGKYQKTVVPLSENNIHTSLIRDGMSYVWLSNGTAVKESITDEEVLEIMEVALTVQDKSFLKEIQIKCSLVNDSEKEEIFKIPEGVTFQLKN